MPENLEHFVEAEILKNTNFTLDAVNKYQWMENY